MIGGALFTLAVSCDHDDDGIENVTNKINSLAFKLILDYSNPFHLSAVGEYSCIYRPHSR